jgi:hypothetical protein
MGMLNNFFLFAASLGLWSAFHSKADWTEANNGMFGMLAMLFVCIWALLTSANLSKLRKGSKG